MPVCVFFFLPTCSIALQLSWFRRLGGSVRVWHLLVRQNICDPPRGLTGRVRECYCFQVEGDYLRNWGPCNNRHANFSCGNRFGSADVLVVEDDEDDDADRVTLSSSDDSDGAGASSKRRRDREEGAEKNSKRRNGREDGSDSESHKRADDVDSLRGDFEDVLREVEEENASPETLRSTLMARKGLSRNAAGHLDIAVDKQVRPWRRRRSPCRGLILTSSLVKYGVVHRATAGHASLGRLAVLQCSSADDTCRRVPRRDAAGSLLNY